MAGAHKFPNVDQTQQRVALRCSRVTWSRTRRHVEDVDRQVHEPQGLPSLQFAQLIEFYRDFNLFFEVQNYF